MQSPLTIEAGQFSAGQNAGATELAVSGMTCQNCARHVTEAIQSVAGVRSAAVSLGNKSASVRWNPGVARNVPAVIEAVKQAGYAAKEVPADASGASCAGHEAKPKNWQWNLIPGVSVTAVLMMGEWIFGLAMTPWFQWLSFALAGGVQVYSGAPL